MREPDPKTSLLAAARSSRLARQVGVTRPTAWYLRHGNWEAFDCTQATLSGTIEIDATRGDGKEYNQARASG